MRLSVWQVRVGILLLLISFLLGVLHYQLFHDVKTLLFYLLLNIVSLPMEVLIVTLIIHELLDLREKREKLEKLNMVIEVFFSEMGTELIKLFAQFMPEMETIHTEYLAMGDWSEQAFQIHKKEIRDQQYRVECQRGDLEELRVFLAGKRDFLLRLLENPNLLEHETFTDLLWAVFHLNEELAHRVSCRQLGETDRGHLANDLHRAYVLLIYEWLGYMQHLRTNYPFLFSLAARLNPFDPNARAELE